MNSTLIVGILVFLASIYQTYKLGQVHTLVNSNFTEAKQARLAAEAALKAADALNISLQEQIRLLTKSSDSLY